MNHTTVLKKKTFLISALFFTFTTATPSQAITFAFNDGTNQGWSVENYYSVSDAQSVSAASWFDNVNYSGDANTGLPPLSTTPDPIDGFNGAINGSWSENIDPGEYLITSFTSPVFAAEEMDRINAQFSQSSQEGGIASSIIIYGEIGYHVQGASGYRFSSFTPLNTEPGKFGNVNPLWTALSFDLTDGMLIDQLLINIRIEGGSPLLTGAQSWIDDVYSSVGNQGPDNEPVPEPATFLLFGTGLAALFGMRKKNLKK